MNSKVSYLEDSIMISVPTSCAAALHEQLIRGISGLLLDSDVVDASDKVAVFELLKSLIPTEKHLSAGYIKP